VAVYDRNSLRDVVREARRFFPDSVAFIRAGFSRRMRGDGLGLKA